MDIDESNINSAPSTSSLIAAHVNDEFSEPIEIQSESNLITLEGTDEIVKNTPIAQELDEYSDANVNECNNYTEITESQGVISYKSTETIDNTTEKQNITSVESDQIDGNADTENQSLFTEDIGPRFYGIRKNLVSAPIIPSNLPAQFNSLPIFGRPKRKSEMAEFFKKKMRQFVGNDISDEDFDQLSKYCSPDLMRTGEEVQMNSLVPSICPLPHIDKLQEKDVIDNAAKAMSDVKLCIAKKFKMRLDRDPCNHYPKKLKYRGMRLMPLAAMEEESPVNENDSVMVEPGKDVLFRFRIYRPNNNHFTNKDKVVNMRYRGRANVFICDVVVAGRQRLSELRDRFVCTNDVGLRLDVSGNPDRLHTASAKTMFPSGFLFINNVFYVDNRPGCSDISAVIREWAANRGIGEFPCRDMSEVRLDSVVMRLGHPEVYVHQGSCEHVFTLSDLRLASPLDPPALSQYPAHSVAAQHQSLYCTTCAEYGAKWIVVGSSRVPFDPAFFCETCFKLYMYRDGEKIGDFKAYAYKGNELNMLKPQNSW